MKDSFKTFPSKHGVTPTEWCLRAEAWKRRIEKEIREKRPKTVINRFNPKHSTEFYADICLEWETFFKEFLGETIVL